MSEFHVMYEGTGGVRLDSAAADDHEATFPRPWIDCYQAGRYVHLSMSDEDGTQVEHKLSFGAALSLGFGLLRAGMDSNLRDKLDVIYKLITGDDPRG